MTDPSEPELLSGSTSSLPISAILFVGSLVLTGVFYFFRAPESPMWIEVGFILAAAAAISVLIAEACEPFADAAQWVGIRLRLPSSVRGATLDAIASSMPELFTGLFFVMVALSGDKADAERLLESSEGYASTIATCAGSSIYNLILIPAVCAIAVSFSRREKPYVEVARDVVHRDGMWVIFTQFGLLIFLFLAQAPLVDGSDCFGCLRRLRLSLVRGYKTLSKPVGFGGT